MKKLVGIRHRYGTSARGYIAKGHPQYSTLNLDRSVNSTCDWIEWRELHGILYGVGWVVIHDELDKGGNGELWIREEECDQFFYIDV